MSAALNTVNNGITSLVQPYTAGDPTMVFAAISVMPSVPFRFAINNVFFYDATAIDGSTVTVTPVEGTPAADHEVGDVAAVVLTSDMFLACYPSGAEFTASGADIQLGRYDFESFITANSAGNIILPTNPVPYKPYTITDIGNNFGSYHQNIEPINFVMGLNNQNGSSYSFVYLKNAAVWEVR